MEKLTFTIAVDDYKTIHQYITDRLESVAVTDSVSDIRRMYITSSVKQRLHQRGFRDRVIHAYREQCAFCRYEAS
ncbi:MAG TPA: hypothetical protein ENO00_07075 [Deltaproteobacteria bacterium]|nr:hypothetical protein [Deltaproteobacteria bacterium]